MNPTTTTVESIAPLGHHDAIELQRAEYERALDLLEQLAVDEWSAPTDCPAWDVRSMWLHVLGASEAGATIRENVGQLRRARSHRRQHGGPMEAALSHVQIEARATLAPGELLERLRAVVPRTIAGRGRMPRPVRALKIAVDGPVVERWTLGYLNDVIYLRDLWMHRIDTCRATGREPILTGEHDGRIVAGVVAEWARRHGAPFRLVLGGPAGGTFEARADAATDNVDHLELDAVEFCRILSGRGEGPGLLETIVPF